MVIKADLHTHSLMSGHAYGTIRGTCDPIYFLNLEDAPGKVYGVKLLYGSEINVLQGGRLSLEERCVEALEVNNSSLRHPEYRLHCVENYEKMLALCGKAGVPVVVSTKIARLLWISRAFFTIE